MLSLIAYLTFKYPKFPTTNNGITSWIIGLFEWIFEVPLVAIANLIAGIGTGFTTGAQTSANNVAGFIGEHNHNQRANHILSHSSGSKRIRRSDIPGNRKCQPV